MVKVPPTVKLMTARFDDIITLYWDINLVFSLLRVNICCFKKQSISKSVTS
jgi:hypothetical protein